MIPTEDQKSHWAKTLTPEQYQGVFGPAGHFEPTGIRDMWFALYGGLIPTAEAAVDYAAVIMHSKAAWAQVAPRDLIAKERDDVWHIRGRHKGTEDLIAISKRTGKLLSGDL